MPLFCRPDLIEFDNLKRSNAHYNLQNAFNIAEKELGLTKLLDPEGKCLYGLANAVLRIHATSAFYFSVKTIVCP